MPKTKTKTSKKTTESKKVNDTVSSKTNHRYDFGKLTRSSRDKIIGGVCGGLAEFFDVDPSLVRIIFALLFVFGGSGFLLYIILWIILPSDGSTTGISEENIRHNAEEIRDRANEWTTKFNNSVKQENSRKVFGLIILFLGFGFLFSNFGLFSFHWIGKLWPIILILLAFSILTNGRDR